MAIKFNLFEPASVQANKLLAPADQDEVAHTIRQNEAAMNQVAEFLDEPQPVDEAPLDESVQAEKLVDDDFPFDASQLNAINGLTREQYGCLTGAAGTGKTTVTKAIVDKLLSSSALTTQIDLTQYWIKGEDPEDSDDEYEKPRPGSYVPSVCICAFTGQASQMVKKNFPLSWHPNIMTIHRMLAYAPEFYDSFDDSSGLMVQKMRFVPTYTAENKLPWDVILIDEAGMQAVDLWNNVWAACKPTTRIYMIGDINQLPPVHGQSAFGFAFTYMPGLSRNTFTITKPDAAARSIIRASGVSK